MERYYSIFALCKYSDVIEVACTFYAIVVAPYKLNMFPNLRLIARYGMAVIGMTSFVLSVLLTLENNKLFMYAYWSTFMLSLYIGTFLVKANKSRTD